MTIEKHGSKWRIREMKDGVRYSVSVDYKPTKAEARALIADRIRQFVTPTGAETIESAAKKYIARREATKSPATLREYDRIIKKLPPALKGTRLSNLKQEDLQGYIDGMVKQGLSPKTVMNRSGLLISVIKERRPEIAFNLNFPQAKKPEFYIPDDDDIKKLYDAVKGSEFEVAVLLGAYGLRRSEICALTLDDIGDGSIRIEKGRVQDRNGDWVDKPTKTTNSTRTIIVPTELTDLIKKQGYVYRLAPGKITNHMRRQQEKLGLKKFTLHKLRHYYASKMSSQRAPDAVIKYSGGWKTDYIMKQVYTHAMQKDVKEEAKKFGAELGAILGQNDCSDRDKSVS